jgi:hypothetical protein
MTGVVKVYNSAGELVATLADQLALYMAPTGLSPVIPAFVPDQNGVGQLNLQGSNVPVIWSGHTDSGQTVDSGVYYVTVEVTDQFGSLTTWSAPLTVVRTDSTTVVEVYNSAGELVWHQAQTPTDPGRVGISGDSLVAGQSGAPLKIVYGSGSADFVMWNGQGSNGQALSGGSYMVKVTQNGAGGKMSTYAFSVVLIPEDQSVFDTVIAAPNPVLPGATALLLSLPGAGPGTTAWGNIYSLAGERVGALSEAAGGGLRWDIHSEIAGGVYLVRVSARNASGNLKSRIVRVAVVR